MFRFLIMMLCLFSVCHAAESNELVVRLSTENQLLPIYLAKFKNDGTSTLSDNYITQMEKILEFDLNHNGMTFTVPQQSEQEQLASQLAQEKYNRNHWRDTAFFVVYVQMKQDKKMEARLLNVNADSVKNIAGLSLSGNSTQDRKTMHLLADTIYKAFFGNDGVASTHILYTIKRPSNTTWGSEIWEADYDGENPRCIIKGGYNIAPIYLPPKKGCKSNSFFYVGYKSAQPKIFIGSLKDGSSQRLTKLRGNQLMPTISLQRDKVAFVCDITGNPDLFLLPFSTDVGAVDKPQQIFAARKATQGSPTFSPDGKKIAFVSNKDGSPKIYVMAVPAPNTPLKDISAQLITKHCSESSAPTWSPDGSKLAYCGKAGGVRQIWMYDFKTKEEKQLTQGGGNKENPSWAPNSLCLVYNSTGQGAYDLYLLNIYQPNPTKITKGEGEKRFPNWEPQAG